MKYNEVTSTDSFLKLFEHFVDKIKEIGMAYPIDNNFTYHAPKEGQQEKYQALRAKAKELAQLILDTCPESRERSVALTELETAMFWSNAAIARN